MQHERKKKKKRREERPATSERSSRRMEIKEISLKRFEERYLGRNEEEKKSAERERERERERETSAERERESAGLRSKGERRGDQGSAAQRVPFIPTNHNPILAACFSSVCCVG